MQIPRMSPGLTGWFFVSLWLTTTTAITAAPAAADTIDVLQADTTVALSTAAPAALPESSPVSTVIRFSQLGMALEASMLEQQRGGSDLGTPVPVSTILSSGVVNDNRATDVVTGSNVIRDGAFTNASGIPVVIQNTGANVLIQNSTIVNLQLH